MEDRKITKLMTDHRRGVQNLFISEGGKIRGGRISRIEKSDRPTEEKVVIITPSGRGYEN